MAEGLDRSREREREPGVCVRRELEIRKDEIWKPWPWRWWLGLDLKREGLWGSHGSWVLIWRERGFEEAMGLDLREREKERRALNLVCVWIGWDSMGLFNIIFVLLFFSIWGYPELEEHEFMCCSKFFVFFPKKSKKKKMIIFWVSKFLGSKSTQILINVIFFVFNFVFNFFYLVKINKLIF